MAPDPTSTPDDEPTQVSPANGDAVPGPVPPRPDPAPANDAPKDVVTDAPLWPEPPSAADAPRVAAGDAASAEYDVPPEAADVPPADAGETAGKRRARSAADRTAEGAKVAADKVSQAASATAQALRETDVNEIARHTTRLIENTRPFFLAAFAIVFTFLATVENHAAIGVIFALAAVLCVLGAAFSPALDQLLKRIERNGR